MNALAMSLKQAQKQDFVVSTTIQKVTTPPKQKVCGADASYALRDWADETDPVIGAKWCLPELRKQDLKGSLKMWQIGFAPSNPIGRQEIGGFPNERTYTLENVCGKYIKKLVEPVGGNPVSYTHLTLPTNSRV